MNFGQRNQKMRLAITLTIFAAVSVPGAARAEDKPNRSTELQVLDRFVGTWDIKTTVKPRGGTATTNDVLSI